MACEGGVVVKVQLSVKYHESLVDGEEDWKNGVKPLDNDFLFRSDRPSKINDYLKT